MCVCVCQFFMRFLPLQQQLTTITTTNSYHIACPLCLPQLSPCLALKRFLNCCHVFLNCVFFAKKTIKKYKNKTRGKSKKARFLCAGRWQKSTTTILARNKAKGWCVLATIKAVRLYVSKTMFVCVCVRMWVWKIVWERTWFWAHKAAVWIFRQKNKLLWPEGEFCWPEGRICFFYAWHIPLGFLFIVVIVTAAVFFYDIFSQHFLCIPNQFAKSAHFRFFLDLPIPLLLLLHIPTVPL